MAKFRLTCEVDLPDGTTESQAEDWARFHLGAIASYSPRGARCAGLDLHDVNTQHVTASRVYEYRLADSAKEGL